MARLGAAVAEAVVVAEGTGGLLRRLSDPFWFQSFGAVLGMDWHSSGVTTSVVGALKHGLAEQGRDLGVHVCGGRGRHSRRTPDELRAVADARGLDGERLAAASRLVAKVDNTAVQDGFQLYLHAFVVADSGEWVVVQQGMCPARREARRYHWRSAQVASFVEEPHAAVVGPSRGVIVNLTDRRAAAARDATVTLAAAPPDATVREVAALCARHAHLPAHHEVRPTDVFLRRLHGVLAVTREAGCPDFESLLLTRGLGPRTLQALALVAEVAHGAPSRFDDPARFAFAHGGKDGHPFPVPLRVYDETIAALRAALGAARVGRGDRLDAFRRLDARARALEATATGPDLDRVIDDEWARSPSRGGKTVMGPAGPGLERRVRPPRQARSAPAPAGPRQLRLFG
jgi:hypothetical protein